MTSHHSNACLNKRERERDGSFNIAITVCSSKSLYQWNYVNTPSVTGRSDYYWHTLHQSTRYISVCCRLIKQSQHATKQIIQNYQHLQKLIKTQLINDFTTEPWHLPDMFLVDKRQADEELCLDSATQQHNLFMFCLCTTTYKLRARRLPVPCQVGIYIYLHNSGSPTAGWQMNMCTEASYMSTVTELSKSKFL